MSEGGAAEVRPATPGDAAAVRALGVIFTPNAADVAEPLFRARFAQVVADEDLLLLVAGPPGEVVGYAYAQDFGRGLRSTFTTGRLHDLVVDPRARHRGVGRALMAAVEAWARTRPDPMTLDWQASTASIGFYTALGYEPDRVGDYKDHPGFSLDTRP